MAALHPGETPCSPKTPFACFEGTAADAAQFYAATFHDSAVGTIYCAPSDYPGGKPGDVLTVAFTMVGIPCIGLNGGPQFQHSEAFSFQIASHACRNFVPCTLRWACALPAPSGAEMPA